MLFFIYCFPASDTEYNRKPAGDKGKWTTPDDIAKLVIMICCDAYDGNYGDDVEDIFCFECDQS
jgi:hypothetical protein